MERSVAYLICLITYFATPVTPFNPGKDGAADAINNWRRFRTNDSEEFECAYDGPTGHGFAGKVVGCQRFFQNRLILTKEDLDLLIRYIAAIEESQRGKNGEEDGMRTSRQMDRLKELLGKLSGAFIKPE